MKRILYLLLFLTAVSCGPASQYARQTTSYFVDYRPYTSDGFWLSPESYPGEYDSIGELTVEILPGLQNNEDFGDGIYSDSIASGLTAEQITTDDLMSELVRQAKAKGANGISNLRIVVSPTDITYGRGLSKRVVSTQTYTATGLCIRIQ